MAGTDHESDKLPRLLWLTWWRRRARTQDRGFSQSQFTTHTLLNRPGHISAGAFLSAVKNHTVSWDRCFGLGLGRKANGLVREALDLHKKSGAFDMQKLANLTISGDPLCTAGPMWPRESHCVVVGGQSAVDYVLGWSWLWTLRFRSAHI